MHYNTDMENVNETSLATELLHELKSSARRWFIAFLVVTVLWFVTIAGFIWYISLPVEESYEITQNADTQSTNQVIGGDNYGGTANNQVP